MHDGDYLIFRSGHLIKHTNFKSRIDLRDLISDRTNNRLTIDRIEAELESIGVSVHKHLVFVNLTVLNKHAANLEPDKDLKIK